jgi:cell division transport system ATP-binding protein
MENIIEFKNVSKTYDSDTHALNNVSIAIEKGEFTFIVGASGAGKSTFLKLIMHEETPSEGTIIVNGTDVTSLKRKQVPYLRRNMGIVFQDFRLIDKMTVYDNVAFAMRAIGASPSAVKKRVNYILGLVGLSHKLKNRPSELSGGEQQRVSLARALVNNPAIIIADEPTGNIDPEMSFEIIELLSQINEQSGTTVLIVTHEHELVKEFNKRVIEIEKGRVVNDTKAPAFDDIAQPDFYEDNEPEEIEEIEENEETEENNEPEAELKNEIQEEPAEEESEEKADEEIPEEARKKAPKETDAEVLIETKETEKEPEAKGAEKPAEKQEPEKPREIEAVNILAELEKNKNPDIDEDEIDKLLAEFRSEKNAKEGE